MKKLRLNVEELRIEQFQTLPDVAVSRGTVQGLQVSLASCVSCPCASGACGGSGGGGETYPSFNNSDCIYCLDEPIGPG